ncbi:MAG TPA: DUF2993 domain-containing protein [Syntrophomonadaceae bacterium]|nr:DUF2993 domain-containing protein [Syntrophomonadaceae bacterium]
MRKLLAGILISLLVFLLLCEFTLPELAGQAVEREVSSSSLKPEGVEARLFAFPAAKILVGQFDGMRLEVRGANLGGCRASLLAMQIPRGSFNLHELMESGGATALHADGPMQVRIVFREEDLNKYLRATGVPGITDPGLELNSRYVKLKGKVGILGSSFSVQMWGNFRPEENGEIAFSPIDFRVGNESLPPELSRKLASRLRFHLNGDRLPFAFKVKQVDVEQGCLVISGESI